VNGGNGVLIFCSELTVYLTYRFSIFCECLAKQCLFGNNIWQVCTMVPSGHYALTAPSSSDNTNNIAEQNELFTFPDEAIRAGEDNVITIVQV
jgi:hypothetical protein